MKKKVLILFLVSTITGNFSMNAEAKPKQLSGTITLSGAFALYPLAVKWGNEFKKIHPNVKIDISAGGAGKGITDALTGMIDLGMASREIHPEEFKKGAWVIPVAKDAVVLIMNEKNPKINELLKKGITHKNASTLFLSKKKPTYGQLLGSSSTIPIHVYTRADACGAAETWASFFGKNQEDLLGTAVYGDPGLASSVQRDALAIGYSNIAYAYNQRTKKPNPGIVVLPLDLNKNGRVDVDENFYATSDRLIAAIAIGKYPTPPARNLYFLSKGKPTNPTVLAFLEFVLTKGQLYAIPNGYINLGKTSLNEALSKLK